MAGVAQPAPRSPGDDDPLVLALRDRGIVDVRPQASLAEVTTVRAGGSARVLVVAERDDDLAAVGEICRGHAVPWTVVGGGADPSVPEAGWPGVAIHLGQGFRGVEIRGDTVRAGAAEPLASLAARVADTGLAGFAWAAAVPGSLGDAVRVNAGAGGGQLADHLVEVDVVRLSSGTRETWPLATLGLGHRRAALPDDAVVVDATLRFPAGSPDRGREP